MAGERGRVPLDDGKQHRFHRGEHQYQLPQPGGIGDKLRIDSQMVQLNGKSGVLSQKVTQDPAGTPVADALLTFVCVDLKTQRALPIEGELREHLEALTPKDNLQ